MHSTTIDNTTNKVQGVVSVIGTCRLLLCLFAVSRVVTADSTHTLEFVREGADRYEVTTLNHNLYFDSEGYRVCPKDTSSGTCNAEVQGWPERSGDRRSLAGPTWYSDIDVINESTNQQLALVGLVRPFSSIWLTGPGILTQMGGTGAEIVQGTDYRYSWVFRKILQAGEILRLWGTYTTSSVPTMYDVIYELSAAKPQTANVQAPVSLVVYGDVGESVEVFSKREICTDATFTYTAGGGWDFGIQLASQFAWTTDNCAGADITCTSPQTINTAYGQVQSAVCETQLQHSATGGAQSAELCVSTH